MKKFLILRDPIELEIPQVKKMTEEKNLISGERKVFLDTGHEVWAYEAGEELKIGELIHYYVNSDQFRRFDPTIIPPKSRLVEIV